MQDRKKQLHPGAKWQFRIGVYVVGIFFMFFIGWFLIPFSIAMATGFSSQPDFGIIMGSFFITAIMYIVIIVLIAEVYARMAYNRWFYEFTPTNLKVEKGIIWKRYSNVPYERVQNVDVRRGIIARILGFSSVMIQTAGFSYTPNARGIGSEGYLPAVSIKEAEEIRDFLMHRISKNSRQGL